MSRGVALVTYSTRPRGGVAHTLALGEALHALGEDVLVVGMGDPGRGFFREVAAPTLVVPAPASNGDLDAKVAASIDMLEEALARLGPERRILHAQDCISARAAARVRDAGAAVTVVRTVHHVDDFETATLMECQRQAILEPDRVLVVSDVWQRILRADYDVAAEVVRNGVDVSRYGSAPGGLAADLRARVGATDRPMVLSVGGIEPRKGTDCLVAAMSRLKHERSPAPVLVVIGGHSFQDHRWYRDEVLASLDALGLEVGTDVVEVGSVPEAEMAAWYAASDVLAFPSVKEGFGLAALEAMAAGTPVVASDLPVFREWIEPDRDALLVEVGDVDALAAALSRTLDDEALRDRLVRSGRAVAARLSWESTAHRHVGLYETTSVPVA